MSIVRNPQQLLLVKQLYEDTRLLAEREDTLSLMKAVILLDLLIVHMLNNIILNLGPDFTVNETKVSEDVARMTLCGNWESKLYREQEDHGNKKSHYVVPTPLC